MTEEKQQYASYNGMSRTPSLAGIPYIAGMSTGTGTILASALVASSVDGVTWVYPLIVGGAVLLFIKSICENDNEGLKIFLLELKWRVIKLGSDSKQHGNTLTIHPIRYGRPRDASRKKYFKRQD